MMRICFVFLLMTLDLQDAVNGALVNIALHKHATQDGVLNYNGLWDVSHSTDGRTNCPETDNSQTHQFYSGTTGDHKKPWWQLDLGSVYEIQAIHVMGRPLPDVQLRGFKLYVGCQPDKLPVIYTNNATLYNRGDIWINTTVTAQVLKIQLPDDRTLTGRANGYGPLVLCEVEVYVYDIKSSSSVSMSSVYQTNDTYFGPRRAIDGVYLTDTDDATETCHCCSVTGGTESPWWTIDFGKQLLMKGVTIAGRPGDNNSFQSKDVSISISNTDPHGNNSYSELVWNISESAPGSNFSHRFDPPRLFQYMTIARLHSTDYQKKFITICEVDFTQTVCPLGTFGDRCGRECHCRDGKPCDPVTGHCQTPGCTDGRAGDACEYCIPLGHYGHNCSDTCGQCINNVTCLGTDGTCPGGCVPGYYYSDKTCKTVCHLGHYGHNCNTTCGNCIDGNTTCSHIDGTCPSGCKNGYKASDSTCKTVCNTGTYGQNCGETCGNCVNGTKTCRNSDGTCPGGCAQGFNGSTCKTVCNTGTYGQNCGDTCGNCVNGQETCRKSDGTCPGGCAQGFKGSTCKTECKAGHYGYNCSETCGRCIDGNEQCVSTDGKCSHGCEAGYNGTDLTCKTECHNGTYGLNCSEICGHCVSGHLTCWKNNGTCSGGCTQGYNGSTCKTKCQIGQYGYNCNETCGHCSDGANQCLSNNGTCLQGCEAGYKDTEPTCRTECDPGNYGQNCSETCGQCINGQETCRKSDGTCPGGCDQGFEGSTCKAKCHAGNYSYNCNETCGRCIDGSEQCVSTDGKCSEGCEAGYTGTDLTCKTECDFGSYGVNCSETCGHCVNGTETCRKSDGTCPDGCAQGFEGVTCKNACQIGHYGYNCNETCGHCSGEASQCLSSNGTCLHGCAAGYKDTDPTCNAECEAGSYGLNCSETCGNCTSGQDKCQKNDGTCPGGCTQGFEGKTCNTTCKDGRFSYNCSETCGNCKGDEICQRTNGTCLTGCQAEFEEGTDRTCRTALKSTGGVPIPPIAGGVAASLIIVLIIIAVLVILKKRGVLSGRKRSSSQDTRTATEFVNMNNAAVAKADILSHQDETHEGEKGGYYSFTNYSNMSGSIKVNDLWTYIYQMRANQFEELFEEFQSIKGGLQFDCDAARSDQNIYKNKYRNMYPYDHCRVKLDVPEGESDYINASHVDGYERVQKFIAAQGPQPRTVEDFWLMIWQQNARTIVMLTNTVEMGKDKCEQYWPQGEESEQYGDITVTIKKSTEKRDYFSRTMHLSRGSEKPRRVEQYHFKSWPDKDVPDSTWCLVHFWRRVTENDTETGPIVVHCSAGIGRTGTFIALDCLYQQAMTEGAIRPVTMIETLRRQRVSMVQTRFQYAYLHEAVAEALLIGTHYYWASQLPSLHAYMTHLDPVSDRPMFETQYEQICKSLPASSTGEADVDDVNIYSNEMAEVEDEPEYGNIENFNSEISEYRPRTKNRNSASIQQMKAVYLPNYTEASTYLISMTPSEMLLADFWSMVDEQNVRTIINLTEDPNHNYQTSCSLGTKGSGTETVGRFEVNCLKETKHHGHVVRTFTYKESGSEDTSTVKVFTLTSWKSGYPYPGDPEPLMGLLEEATKWHPYVSEAKPVLFICGNGRTRCGLVAAIHNESQRMRNDDGKVNIVETVMTMKKRVGEIISSEQFKFLYDAVYMFARRAQYVPETVGYTNM